MVNMMNIGHSPMAEWGLKHIKINKNDISLDVGCAGGANLLTFFDFLTLTSE